MLISGMTVEKGPALTRDVANSVGGGVAVTTLEIDDVVQEGRNFGVDVKVEASTNAVRPRWPSMQQGIKARSDHYTEEDIDFNYFIDSDLMRHAKKGGRYALGRDQAARIALGARRGDFDFLAAYAWRHKGNHYAGRNGSKYYKTDPNTPLEAVGYTRYLAHLYYPGAEVPNTSSDMKSLLLKATWRPIPYQRLQLGWRDTRAEYGEIMPSRLGEGRYRLKDVEQEGRFNDGSAYSRFLKKYAVGTVAQWPSSRVHTQAANLDYKWNPPGRYVDFHANLWATRNDLNTHTSGGLPREPYSVYDDKPELKYWNDILHNTSLTHSDDRRWGINTSNKFKLHDKLDLTLSGSYQRETFKSKDNWWLDPRETASPSVFRAKGREGWHRQWDTSFRFDWRPADWLSISAGARKNGYSAFDSRLARGRAEKDYTYRAKGREYRYINWKIRVPEDLKRAWEQYEPQLRKIKAEEAERIDSIWKQNAQEERDMIDSMCSDQSGSAFQACSDEVKDSDEYSRLTLVSGLRIRQLRKKLLPRYQAIAEPYEKFVDSHPTYSKWRRNGNFNHGGLIGGISKDGIYQGGEIQGGNPRENHGESYIWRARDDNKLHKDDSPAINGTVAAENGHDVKVGAPGTEDIADPFPKVEKKGGVSSWQPVLAVTLRPTENSRLYARYARTTRFPSIFESTVGFSGASRTFYKVAPERATNVEFGYTHDLSTLFKAEQADIKLAYYRTTVKDVIDRTLEFNFRNIEAQKTAGIELQSRYDNGCFFADFSATYNLKNEVCDESSAIFLDPVGRIPTCLKDGPPASYLHNMTPPKYSLNLTLGARFLNRRLEVGSRILHHAGLRNHDRENYGDLLPQVNRSGNNIYNVPIYWGRVTTMDAWVNYKFRKDLNVEFVVTNLTDQYYLDPLTRTNNPAPGRTFRIGVSKKF